MNVREITERGRRAGHIRTISDRDHGSQQILPGSRAGVLLKSRDVTPSRARRIVVAAPVSSRSLFDGLLLPDERLHGIGHGEGRVRHIVH